MSVSQRKKAWLAQDSCRKLTIYNTVGCTPASSSCCITIKGTSLLCFLFMSLFGSLRVATCLVVSLLLLLVTGFKSNSSYTMPFLYLPKNCRIMYCIHYIPSLSNGIFEQCYYVVHWTCTSGGYEIDILPQWTLVICCGLPYVIVLNFSRSSCPWERPGKSLTLPTWNASCTRFTI